MPPMTTKSEDRPKILMAPPVAALTGLIVCVILHLIWKPWWLPGFPNPWTIILGGLMVAGGFALAIWAANLFHGADTNIDPRKPAEKIVTSGPYRFTRNPMYVGLLSVHFGVGLALSLDWTLVVTVVLWAFLHWGVVLREESYLTDKFGADYEELLSQTRRWI